jgi:hypothetical protein
VGGGERGAYAKCALPLAHVGQSHAPKRGNRAVGSGRVQEVFATAKLEGLVVVVIIADLREPADCPAVCDDVEEPQKLAVDPPVPMTQGRKA